MTFGPSPVHPLDRLTEHLGGAEIWAKREDVNSGLAYGGNKTRKLEYLIPDALAPGADTLVSIGGRAVQPHPPGRRSRGEAGPEGRAGAGEAGSTGPMPVNDKVGNILLSRIMGADVRLDPSGFGIGFKDSWQRALEDVERGRRNPVRHPGRRIGPPARRARLRQLGLRGRRRRKRTRRLLRHDRRLQRHRLHARRHDRRLRRSGPAAAGCSASTPRRRSTQTRDQVERIARNTAALIGLGRDLRDDEITVLEGWAGDYYGIPVRFDHRRHQAHRPARGHDHRPRLRGEVDGRLIDLVRSGEIDKDSKVLYAHLGGQPALNAYSGIF